MERKNKQIVALILNLSIVIMEIIGIILSAQTHGIGGLKFYTEDSNIFALIASTIYCIVAIGSLRTGNKKIYKWVHILRYMSTCCLTVTFVVVMCVLAPTGGMGGYVGMMLTGSMLYHHFLCPVVAAVSFFFFETDVRLENKHVLYALIPTVTYAVVAVILNIAKVLEGPYPFLRVYDQPVYMSVVWCIVIMGGALLFAWIIRKINLKSCGKLSEV